MTTDSCVFCDRREQPPALFETAALFAMPDRYPMRPGHVLIISREHRRCYAAVPADVLGELDAAAARVRRFLEAAYGGPVAAFENGVAGQTVCHAHLHLVPGLGAAFPASLLAHADVSPVAGWGEVQAHYAQHGHYRYLELAGRRYVIAGYSPALRLLREGLAAATGMVWRGDGWDKRTTPADVAELGRRWLRWPG